MKKWLRWIPLILSLILIFGLTFQNCRSSRDMTVAIQTVTDYVANANQGSHWWNDYRLMRRLGHTAEYLILGLSSMYALRRWWKAGILCVVVSFIDEIIKGILPGREFDFVDMRFDLIGYVIGIVIMILIWKFMERRKKVNNNENSLCAVHK